MKRVFSPTKALIAILLPGALIWAACTKNNNNSGGTTSASNTTLMASVDASADASFTDLTNNILSTKVNGQSYGAVDDSTSSFSQVIAKAFLQQHVTVDGPDSSNQVTISVTPGTAGVWPETVTINFGSGFKDLWGNVYTGSISMVFSGPLVNQGASVTTTFNNYSFDSIQLTGTHILTNTSTGDTSLSFSVQIENAKVTLPNGFWVNWNASRNWARIAGGSTPFWPFDDVYNVTGNGGGSASGGFTWTTTIETPLQRAYVCPWFESGTVKIATNYGTGVLDYGSGSCDNQATVTVGDTTKNITL